MLRKEILTVFSGLIVSAMLLTSCAEWRGKREAKRLQKERGIETSSNSGTTGVSIPKEPKKIEFTFNELIPHCGGAAPMPDMKYPIVSPIENQKWILFNTKNDGSKNLVEGELVTNEEGVAKYAVQPGTYQIWKESKLLSLENFMKKEKVETGKFYEYGDKECFEKWRTTPDFVFTVVSDTSLVFNFRVNCYTGTNPCLKYTGPWAP